MYWEIRRRRRCTTSSAMQHLIRTRREPGRASVVLEVSAVRTAATGSSISKAEIWMIFSEISLEVCSAEAAAEVIADSVASTARDLEAVSYQSRGQDIHTEISVSFDEAAFGCDKMIRLQKEDGSIQTLQVHIPEGMEDGKSIRLRGKGAPGTGGGQPGDLFMKVHVGTRPGFERKGSDIYTTVQVPFTTAVFGGEVMVETLTGRVLCKIRKGTQSGSRIRLKGKGVASMNQPSVHGDQYVTVQIQVPTSLSPEAEQKLREYEAACKGGRKRGNSAA